MKHGRSGHTYILGGENCTYSEFYHHLSRIGMINRKMIKVPLFLQSLFARIQLILAETIGKEPSITPKWVAKGKYNWEVTSSKSRDELGYYITSLEVGLQKTIAFLKKN
jgi:hypothetical protein